MTTLTERLRASPTSQIMLEAADRIKGLQVQAQYEADVAEAALENARELCAEKSELERIIGQQAEAIRALLDERDALREALEIARDFVAEALAQERDAYRGYESVSSIADIERYLAQIDAALAQEQP